MSEEILSPSYIYIIIKLVNIYIYIRYNHWCDWANRIHTP